MTSPTPSSRGPSGRAPMPPPWLPGISLPLDLLPAGTKLSRVHAIDRAPMFFGPGKGRAPTCRFDSLTGAYGVLYVGCGLEAALVETLLRAPARRMVDYSAIAGRASCQLAAARDLRIVRLHGAGLQAVGCDNAISTGPYEPCGAWADALWSHPDKPDGIAYQSRHDPRQICVALFERDDLALQAAGSLPLTDQIHAIARILGAYGKSIANVPM